MRCTKLALLALSAVVIAAPFVSADEAAAEAAVEDKPAATEGVSGDHDAAWTEPEWITNSTLLYAVLSDVANDPTVISYASKGSTLTPSSDVLDAFKSPYRLEGVYKGTFGKGNYKVSALYDTDSKHLVLAYSGHPDEFTYEVKEADRVSQAERDARLPPKQKKNNKYRDNSKYSDSVKYMWETVADIRIHRGFASHYDMIREATHISLRNHPGISKVTTTGHGYGAAHATFAAMDIGRHFNVSRIESVTFGSPRVGNMAFRDEYRSRVNHTLRVVLVEADCIDGANGQKTPAMCQDQVSDRPPHDEDFIHVEDATFFKYATDLKAHKGKPFDEKLHKLESYEECIAMKTGRARAADKDEEDL